MKTDRKHYHINLPEPGDELPFGVLTWEDTIQGLPHTISYSKEGQLAIDGSINHPGLPVVAQLFSISRSVQVQYLVTAPPTESKPDDVG